MKTKNIIPHQFFIDRKKREELKGHSSFLIWFTGLSGSGKSTIASRLEEELFNRGYHTYILDGDNLRSGLNSDLDFTDYGRKENIRRVGEVANLFIDAGIVVLASFISPFRSEREFVKNTVGESKFFEVFVDCSIAECELRDVKGLYKKARAGEISNFTGISSPYEIPENPDLLLDTSKNTIDESVQKLIDKLALRFALND